MMLSIASVGEGVLFWLWIVGIVLIYKFEIVDYIKENLIPMWLQQGITTLDRIIKYKKGLITFSEMLSGEKTKKNANRL